MSVDMGLVRARQQQYLRAREACEAKSDTAAERESVVNLTQQFLRQLNDSIPGVVVGSDADVRRLAEAVTSVILSAR